MIIENNLMFLKVEENVKYVRISAINYVLSAIKFGDLVHCRDDFEKDVKFCGDNNYIHKFMLSEIIKESSKIIS